MKFLRPQSIKNKLILLSAVSGAMALVLGCAGFLLNDLRLLRDSRLRQLITQAELLGFNSSVVLEMGQGHQADELLVSLRSQPSIQLAGLYNRSGRRIASYSASGSLTAPAQLPQTEGSRLTASGHLEVFQPVIEQGSRIGTVYLQSNLNDIWNQFYSYSRVSLLVMGAALAVATLSASRMQRSISGPILELANAAREITTKDDYSIRVHTEARDELGLLYASFNRMIDQVDASRFALERAHCDLERRIEERTHLLLQEVEHRKRVQSELVRAKDKAEAASRAKSSFLANMSHEIRTPLNAILGFADLLRRGADGGDEAERHDFLETIHRSGEHLLALINDILDLSKIESGQMEFENIRFSPHQVIAEVMSVLRVRAQQKGLALEYRWCENVPETIVSDPARFRQLLLNLVGNAIKFTENGSVQVVAKLDHERQELSVDIIDTGIGIPQEMQGAIFSPFTQADSSVTRRFGGTGLGLSISRHIASGLGGRISVRSEPGKGSTFTATVATGSLENVRLLACPASDSLPVHGFTTASPNQRLEGVRILIADDGETNRKLIRLVLSRAGADIVTVDNGMEAVSAAAKNEFDLVLMDMQMPVMDGYTATERLRNDGFEGPVVALTANAMRGDADRCLGAGCSDYLTKPINPERLLNRICEIVTEYRGASTADEDGRRDGDADVGEQPGSISRPTIRSELPADDADFIEILREFVDRLHLKIAELHIARQSGDTSSLADLAHWLVGAGGSAGFPMLTETARELETALQDHNIAAVDVLLSRLDEIAACIVIEEPVPA
jgi:two-component system, sensor histidine kinase